MFFPAQIASRWRQWYERRSLRLGHFLDRLFGVPSALTLSKQAERELQVRLARVLAWLMLAFGIPVNTIVAADFYQKIYIRREMPVTVSYNHLFWFVAGSLTALILLRKGRPITALYAIISAAALSVFIQMYLTNDVGAFVGMLLIMATPTVAFSVRENLRISALLIVGVIIFRIVLQLGGDFFGSLLGFLSIESSFILFSAGIRRVLGQTLAHQERTVKQAIQAEADVKLAKQQVIQAQAKAQLEKELEAARVRAQISRDLHDSLGAGLTTIGLQLQACSNSLADHPATAKIAAAQRLTDQLLEEARRTVHNLRAPVAQPMLCTRIDELLETDRATGLTATVYTQGTPRPLSTTVEEVLFRVAQEGVTNMRRHAHATSLSVQLDYRNPTRVCLRLQDNGQGAHCTMFAGGSGLQGMRERLQALGGDVFVHSAPGQGFQLTAEVPA